jgi:hypothetical protein
VNWRLRGVDAAKVEETAKRTKESVANMVKLQVVSGLNPRREKRDGKEQSKRLKEKERR